jgi:hypothetical protein
VKLTGCRVLCILALVSLVAAPIGLFASLFIYDSPHAGGVITGAMALSIWTFPLTALIGGLKGLKSVKAGREHSAIGWTTLAWMSQLVFVVSLLLSMSLCKGSFECY